MPIAIGVDIGGSHISCAAVDTEKSRIIPNTYFHDKVNSKGSKDEILKRWGSLINKTIKSIVGSSIVGIGFAMPGPFRYKEGIAMFEVNDKYEALYNVSVIEELPKFLSDKKLKIRFLNDASSFGLGSMLNGGVSSNKKVIAITLGTGFGAAFFEGDKPLIVGDDIPENGCLWDKDYKDGISDDYFSTRWFVKEHRKNNKDSSVLGVKSILDENKSAALELFDKFNDNFIDFMKPYLLKFNPDVLIIGGSIAKSSELFVPTLKTEFNKSIPLEIIVINNTEEANIIGASYAMNDIFWNKIRNILPEI